ncbi:MAG: nicotinate-nucleotide adenylyltransferase [Desulfobacterales bacterium]|nr:nicotinate-nucleotide adenylyltransferase [Desulfobacterales bacterium]
MDAPQRLGLFGGTFDPVHNGHLAAADAVWATMGLDQLWFVPAARPPHKLDHPVLDFEQRVAMLEQAVATRDGYTLSLLEAELARPSFTIDTLRELRNRLGPGTRLFFIIGQDSFAEIDTWKSFKQIPALADLVIIPRPSCPPVARLAARFFPGYRRSFEDSTTWEQETDPAGGRIHLLDMTPVEISSSEIRALVRQGRPIRDLVPAVVADYIQEHRLYRASVPCRPGKIFA